MKYLRNILATLLLTILCTTFAYATEDTSVQDLVGANSTETTTTTNTISATEENPLALEIPGQTDNPSTIITFTNPSTENASVQLEIDSKGFSDISSPYTFPALSIGKHTLEFKYKDENDATQIFSTSIIIIPRAPILNAPTITADLITVSGTGLANSEIIVLLSSGTIVSTKTGVIDSEGKWALSFDRKDIENEIYSINAFTRRYGYASDLSETTKFTLDTSSGNDSSSKNYLLDLSQLSFTVVEDWFLNNQMYILIGVCAFILGIVIGIFSKTQKAKLLAQRAEEKVTKEFHKKTENKKQEMTLREKLMEQDASNKNNEKKEPISEPAKEKREETPVISKINFLKDFKRFDPDDAQGKEEKSTVDVTLTSKK